MRKMTKIFLIVLPLIFIAGCTEYNNKVPEKPGDTSLEFWIAENVEDVDFSVYDEIYGWFGAREFLGRGYISQIDENGRQVFPLRYVSYIVSAYPDYADGGRFITEIRIHDPNVSVYNLTIESSMEDFDRIFSEMGYTVSVIGPSGATHKAEKDGVSFVFNLGSSITISVNVSNRDGIIF